MGSFDWGRLIAHNHPLTVSLGGTKIHVCARCSGVVMGIISTLFLSAMLDSSMIAKAPFAQMLPICVMLAIPASFDWVTQSWGLRKSCNGLRVFTGLLEGAGVALLALIDASIPTKLGAVLSVGGAVVLLGILGRQVHIFR